MSPELRDLLHAAHDVLRIHAVQWGKGEGCGGCQHCRLRAAVAGMEKKGTA